MRQRKRISSVRGLVNASGSSSHEAGSLVNERNIVETRTRAARSAREQIPGGCLSKKTLATEKGQSEEKREDGTIGHILRSVSA